MAETLDMSAREFHVYLYNSVTCGVIHDIKEKEYSRDCKPQF